MGSKLSTPYDGRTYPVEDFTVIELDRIETRLAVNQSGQFFSINFRDLVPGDVFLFCEKAKGLGIISALAVESYQTAVCGKDVARWRHVGILDDNYNVWDAMPQQDVRCRPLRELLKEKTEIAVVRPKVFMDPVRLQCAIATMSRGSYNIFAMETGAVLAARLTRTKGLKNILVDQALYRIDNSLICSSFVTNVLRYATQQPFFRKLEVVVPADFLQDNMFQEVDLNWCRLVLSHENE